MPDIVLGTSTVSAHVRPQDLTIVLVGNKEITREQRNIIFMINSMKKIEQGFEG